MNSYGFTLHDQLKKFWPKLSRSQKRVNFSTVVLPVPRSIWQDFRSPLEAGPSSSCPRLRPGRSR